MITPHSFLEKIRSKQPRKKNPARTLLISIIVFVLVYFCALSFALVEVYRHSTTAVQSLKEAKGDAMTLHFDETNLSLQKAKEAFLEAKKYSVLLKTAMILPIIGSSIEQSDQLIAAGIDVVTSLQSVSDIGKDVMQLSGVSEQYFAEVQQGTSPRISFTDLSPQTRQLVLARLEASSNKFSVLSQRLALVQDELNNVLIHTGGGPFATAIISAQKELVQTQATLQQASLFTDIIPAFSGVQKTAHHLVLFLNNAELRPSGGFVGNYGIATVTKGVIESVKTSDVYALDRLADAQKSTPLESKEPAPFPLQQYNATPYWYFRDANWSPDFSISAGKMISKFKEESSILPSDLRSMIPYSDSIDGVVAFTPTLASRLLKLVGPVTVSGQTFTAENIADKLEYQVEFAYAKQGIPEAQRKEVIGQLMDAVVQKMTAMPLSEWSSVLTLVQEAFQNRQLFLYHSDPAIEQVITNAGWSGRYLPKTPDVQLVVDANLASLKTDPVVDRSIQYQIATDASGERIGRTSITYHHTGKFDWKTSRYRTYTRLYVPLGSKLIRVTGSVKNDVTQNQKGETGSPDISSELGMTVFGAFTSIEPGQTGTLTFEYKLADSVRAAIAENKYVLQVWKQNGARDHALTLNLDFGKNVLRAIPPEESKEWGDAHYKVKTVLDQDKIFQIGL